MARKMRYIMTQLKVVKRPSALSQLNTLKGIRLTSHVSRLTVFTLFAFLVGCAAPQQQVERRYFWPPLPDTPRIEFVAAYWGDQDLPKSTGQRLLESIGGTEPKELGRPWGVYSEGRKVFLTDPEASRVVVFDFEKNKVRTLGEDESEGLYQNPMGITLDGEGNVYVSDSKKNQVFVFTRDEKPLMSIGGAETLDWPVGMVVDDKRGRLYVVNSQGHNIAVFDLSGKYLFSIGKRGKGDGEFNYPVDVDLDSKGNIVVSDSLNARVQILDPDGRFVRKFGIRGDGILDFQLPKGIAVDRGTDNIYIVDSRLNKLLIFSKEGEGLMRLGGEAGGGKGRLNPGGFTIPQDVMINRQGEIYVADSLNRRFQVFQIITEDWLKRNPIEK